MAKNSQHNLELGENYILFLVIKVRCIALISHNDPRKQKFFHHKYFEHMVPGIWNNCALARIHCSGSRKQGAMHQSAIMAHGNKTANERAYFASGSLECCRMTSMLIDEKNASENRLDADLCGSCLSLVKHTPTGNIIVHFVEDPPPMHTHHYQGNAIDETMEPSSEKEDLSTPSSSVRGRFLDNLS